ncbi:MAG: DNA polymerase III subunit delta [Candidatus Paceibacterota bacterium]
MIIFLYGPDTFRSRKKLSEIIERYQKVHKSGLNLRSFEGQSFTFQDLKAQLQSISMFKEKKLAVIKNAFGNKVFKELFLKNSDYFLRSEDIIVFFEEGDVPARDALSGFLKEKAGKSQEFGSLSGAQLKSWIRKEFKNYETEVEAAAVDKLAQEVGGDLWQMSNEIMKLVNYKERQKVGLDDVKMLVSSKIETDIFKTVDFIAKRDKKNAFRSIKDHLEKGDAPLYILSMINFQFRNLILVKAKCAGGANASPGQAASLAKEMGMHPFVFRKALYQSQSFSLEELKKIYQNIFKMDLAAKTGDLSPETALDLFISSGIPDIRR